MASPQQQQPFKASRMRRHGCQTPWALAQIVAVGVVLLSVAVFYIFTVHELPSDLRRTVLLLVSVQVAMVAVLFAAISLLDPAHPAVIERHRQQQAPSIVSATQSPCDSTDLEGNHHHPLNALTGEGGDGTSGGSRVGSPTLSAASSSSSTSSHLQCALCDAGVSAGTRHCSVCRKCVAGFDHHCVYLNTCIGSRNYPLFIALLTCSILLVATQLVIAGFAIDRLRKRGEAPRAVIVGLLCTLPLLQLVSMVVLASFHTYLFCKGLRTYEWLRRFHERSLRYTAKTPTWKHQRRATRHEYEEDPTVSNDSSANDASAHHSTTIEATSQV